LIGRAKSHTFADLIMATKSQHCIRTLHLKVKAEGYSWLNAAAIEVNQAQRRGHKRQAKRLHRTAARRRKDALHKFSRKIVNAYQTIFVGNVSSLKLVKTRMAKSVLGAGAARPSQDLQVWTCLM